MQTYSWCAMTVEVASTSRYGSITNRTDSHLRKNTPYQVEHSRSLSPTWVSHRLTDWDFSRLSYSVIADRDGTIDLVFPTCKSVTSSTGVGNDCSINIAYNKQLPLCSADAIVQNGAKKCRSPEDLCIADPDFKFDLSSGSDVSARSHSLCSFQF